MMLTGGCYCGAVRYEVSEEPFHRTLCHCADCRRIAGAPAVAWFSVTRAGLRYTRGAPAQFQSSAQVTRSFCAQCGTALSYVHHRWPDEIDITTCSLDEPDAAAPLDHTFTASAVRWLHICDGLPRYPRSRAEGQNE
jgi:hypothetical protein